LLSSDAHKVVATHFVKKSVRPDPRYQMAGPAGQLNETLLSLCSGPGILAARLAGGRLQLLDTDSLRLRSEIKLKGLLATAISGNTLYCYTAAGILYAFHLADPENPSQLWALNIPKVPDPKGIVIDGDRVVVHGIGLTEVWINGSRPPTYYQVGNKWKSLECVI